MSHQPTIVTEGAGSWRITRSVPGGALAAALILSLLSAGAPAPLAHGNELDHLDDATPVVQPSNEREERHAALTITKVVDGLGAGGLDGDVVFSGTWVCGFAGEDVSGEWSIKGPGSTVVAQDLMVGSDCTVAEHAPSVDPVQGDVRFVWDGTMIDAPVVILEGGSEVTATSIVAFGDVLPDSEAQPRPARESTQDRNVPHIRGQAVGLPATGADPESATPRKVCR